MFNRFPQKRAIITGAGSGLGRAFACELAKMNWHIAIAEINPQRAEATARSVSDLGGYPLEVGCDVSKPEDLEQTVRNVVNRWDGIDIFINNAGVCDAGFFEEIPMHKWEWIMTVNLKSVIHGCRAAIPVMKQQAYGHIINVASNSGIACLPEMCNYNVTKAGVIAISETLRSELAPFNIDVSVVCPTFFKTNLMDQFTYENKRQLAIARAFFDKSYNTAEEVAKHALRRADKKRLYLIKQIDGKFVWYSKRFFPEMYHKSVSWLYKTGLFEKYLGLDLSNKKT